MIVGAGGGGLLVDPTEQCGCHMFAVGPGRAGAFSVETMWCDGDACVVGLGLAALHGAKQRAAFGSPVDLVHGATGFVNLPTGGGH